MIRNPTIFIYFCVKCEFFKFYLMVFLVDRIKKILHTTVLRSDLLSAPATLRYKGEGQYESFALGIISILTVAIFITVFFFSFAKVLELQSITAFQ